MAADHRTIRRARTLAWRRITDSDARHLLASAEERARTSTGAGDLAVAREAIAEALAIVSSGGMRLCEEYGDRWIAGSDVPLSRYAAYERARGMGAVRVGLDGEDPVWWYRDAYYVARPHQTPDAVEGFARMWEAEERRRLARFRARIAGMSSRRGQRLQTRLTTDLSAWALAAEPLRGVLNPPQ